MIFSTSRGKSLDVYLEKDCEAVVFSRSGGKIAKIKEEVLEKIPKYKKKYQTVHVYFLVGIPDITKRIRRGAYEEFAFIDEDDTLASNIQNQILELSEAVKIAGCEVCVCTVASMDLEKWNMHRLKGKKTSHLELKDQYKSMQKKMEKAILQINKSIASRN